MNKSIPEAIELVNGLKRNLFEIEGVDIVLCPPFTALSEISEILISSNVKLGAQNMHSEYDGAYTGEVSGLMLKDAGCEFVILGHSERRQYFKEIDAGVNSKIKAALKLGLTPIVCVGETLEEREREETFKVVEGQLSGALKAISGADVARLIFAYEPIWAIGTGRTATSSQAQEVHKFIRSLLEKWYNKETAQLIRIQYGGSVKPENIKDLISQPDIDGALVGGASLNIESFSQIVRTCTDF